MIGAALYTVTWNEPIVREMLVLKGGEPRFVVCHVVQSIQRIALSREQARQVVMDIDIFRWLAILSQFGPDSWVTRIVACWQDDMTITRFDLEGDDE